MKRAQRNLKNLYKAYNSIVSQNILINNVKDGICVVTSSTNIKFNIISGNTRYGLFILNNGSADDFDPNDPDDDANTYKGIL